MHTFPLDDLRERLKTAGLDIVRAHVVDFAPDSAQAAAELQGYLIARS